MCWLACIWGDLGLYLRCPPSLTDLQEIFDINTQFKWDLPAVASTNYPPETSIFVKVNTGIVTSLAWKNTLDHTNIINLAPNPQNYFKRIACLCFPFTLQAVNLSLRSHCLKFWTKWVAPRTSQFANTVTDIFLIFLSPRYVKVR